MRSLQEYEILVLTCRRARRIALSASISHRARRPARIGATPQNPALDVLDDGADAGGLQREIVEQFQPVTPRGEVVPCLEVGQAIDQLGRAYGRENMVTSVY